MSSILQQQQPSTKNFDANKSEHRKAYVAFLAIGKWPVRFELEFPFTSIPSMVMFKLALRACSNEGATDMTAILAKSAYLQTETATSINDRRLEKVA